MGVPTETVKAFLSRRRFSTIGHIRSLAVSSLFEIELYKDPDRDLDRLKYDLSRKYLLLRSWSVIWREPTRAE